MPQALTTKEVHGQILALADRPEELKAYLDNVIPILHGPAIDHFLPAQGQPGTLLEIYGSNFSPSRDGNNVTVGGEAAQIIKAGPTHLRVITSRMTKSGSVSVIVNGTTATCPYPFKVLPYPKPDEDGPPILFSGEGSAEEGGAPAKGTLHALAVLVHPSDRAPANGTTTRNDVSTLWDHVHTFYEQGSYASLDVDVDVTANWHVLSGKFADYVAGDNIDPNVLDRLMAETAKAAQDENFNLDNYDVMACVMNMNGFFIRAWGNWTKQNFYYDDGAGHVINITANHALWMMAINESATWGRFAHELGHDIISTPSALSAPVKAAVLKEDVYASDLQDPGIANAASFDIMGEHDSGPMFSAYYVDQMGWYSSSNVLDLPQWDRNPFKGDYDVVAHGLTQNTQGGRYHLLRLKVADGLYYYVEVRQRPGATAQIFDGGIPLGGATQSGGVVVTKVLEGVVNMNQQMRFITLLHDPCVLKQGEAAVDPARALKITVLDDHVGTAPLVCRVRVEWAQSIADDPNGKFDLRVEPWDAGCQTPDIWIDRIPYGTYDKPKDADGRPQGNGDKPRPMEVNHFWTRIHCDGSPDSTGTAKNVKVTFYAVNPPGVGDNGNWGPLKTVPVDVPGNSYKDLNINWVPQVGEHTCLKVWAEPQLGEIAGGNNSAQENVFEFAAPAASVPEPVIMPVAVRNPRDEPTSVIVSVQNVPTGYTVHFPHAWLNLDGRGERRLELVIIPTRDYTWYREVKQAVTAPVRVLGFIPREYGEETAPDRFPASIMSPIGGITARVTPKRRVELELHEDKESRNLPRWQVALAGHMAPALGGERVRVDLLDPNGRLRVAEVTTDAGGHYRATFDLNLQPSLDVEVRPTKERPKAGVYKAQAFVINSPHAAPADSNVVYVKK